MLTMKTLKNTRAVTYRRYGIPALILEGKWLTEKYRLNIGDQVDIDYQSKEIRLRKNPSLSAQNQKRLRDKVTFKQVELDHDKNEITSEGSTGGSQG